MRDAGRLAASLAALDRSAETTGSATELPVLGPIRLLVAAAAAQGERPKLPDAGWRARVLSIAFPPAPAEAAR